MEVSRFEEKLFVINPTRNFVPNQYRIQAETDTKLINFGNSLKKSQCKLEDLLIKECQDFIATEKAEISIRILGIKSIIVPKREQESSVRVLLFWSLTITNSDSAQIVPNKYSQNSEINSSSQSKFSSYLFSYE